MYATCFLKVYIYVCTMYLDHIFGQDVIKHSSYMYVSEMGQTVKWLFANS